MNTMKREYKILLIGISAIVLLDILGSIASRQFVFNYSLLSPVSFVIYGTVGFLTTRIKNLKTAVLSGAILGFFDSTVGFKISMLFDAYTGELEYPTTKAVWITTFVLITGLAALAALLGGGLARMVKKESTNV
jgi:hypothetical protein